MEIRSMRAAGLSISEIARRQGLDRKTVRKYVTGPHHGYQRPSRPSKLAAHEAWLRERWERGVHNAAQLLRELRARGYQGGSSQLRQFVRPWRQEARERAFVRFETEPGRQAQLDWGTLAWAPVRVFVLAMTLGWSRMRFVWFSPSQDIEHLLEGLVLGFEYFGGVPQEVLTDNMKTVVLGRCENEIRWNPRILDFSLHHGFLPRVCQPRRPQTKGKIESGIGFVKHNFWPGIDYRDYADLNRQARDWLAYVNHQVHATTREVPAVRWEHEGLQALPAHRYDTGYAAFRKVAKDCLLSYGGSRYSVPHAYAGKAVVVRRPVEGSRIRIFHQADLIAEHALSASRGAMVMDASHYQGLRGRPPYAHRPTPLAAAVLPAGPGVGRSFAIPQVAERSLSEYEGLEASDVAAI